MHCKILPELEFPARRQFVKRWRALVVFWRRRPSWPDLFWLKPKLVRQPPVVFLSRISGALLLHRAVRGRYLHLSYPPSTVEGELQIGAAYTLWIPDGLQTVRAVIVHQPGASIPAAQAGATSAYDLHWQALAKKWDCVLLGPSYRVLNDAIDLTPGGAELWFDP